MTQKWLTMAEAEAYSGYGRKTLIAKAITSLTAAKKTGAI